MVTPVAKRQAVLHLQKALELSERRACALVGLARRVARYVSTRADGGIDADFFCGCRPLCKSFLTHIDV